jgi:hypothetical protein
MTRWDCVPSSVPEASIQLLPSPRPPMSLPPRSPPPSVEGPRCSLPGDHEGFRVMRTGGGRVAGARRRREEAGSARLTKPCIAGRTLRNCAAAGASGLEAHRGSTSPRIEAYPRRSNDVAAGGSCFSSAMGPQTKFFQDAGHSRAPTQTR